MKIYYFIITLFAFTIVFAQDVKDEFVSKGNENYKQAQFDRAIFNYQQAIKKSPTNQIALYNLANAYIQQKNFKEAQNTLDKLIANTNDKILKSYAHYNKGVSYTKQKDLELSIEAYKSALRLNPNDKQARENLQKALLEQKKQKQQKQDQQKQKNQSSMSQKEAEQKLKLLQEREKQLQEKLQGQKSQGTPMSKDW